LNAVRQKQHELAGQAVLGDLESDANAVPETYAANLRGAGFAEGPARGEPRPLAAAPSYAGQWMLIGTPLRQAVAEFLEHIQIHSPEKPATLVRYRCAMEHFLRLVGHRRYVEAVTRNDIEHYKQARVHEPAGLKRKPTTVRPSTVNFELGVVRRFYNFRIRKRTLPPEGSHDVEPTVQALSKERRRYGCSLIAVAAPSVGSAENPSTA
jgi:hypothetical protein